MTATTAASVAPKAVTKKIVRLNTNQREEIIAFWKSGTMKLEELATKYKVDITTIKRLVKKAGAKKNETEAATKKIAEAVVESTLISDATIYASRVKETKEDHYRMATTLGKLIFSKVVNAERAGTKIGVIAGDIKALQLAVVALKVIREERYATLGISPDDAGEERPLPDLIVQELTVEDIQEMSKGNFVDDDDIDFDMDDMGDEDLIDKEEMSDKVITE